MIFNSIEFGIFFTLVFIAYWTFFNKDTRTRNIFLILASYLFYGWWDWRFLSLIAISSLIDFYIGKKIFEENKNSKKKRLLFVSLFVNLGFLGFFKYFNFFIDNLINSFSLLGISIDSFYITIILPVGISFYTFQTLSYTIDIYFGKIRPTKELFSFLAFVSFFPQLVAGPIERAKSLLPQFYIIRPINYESLRSGLYLMTLGFFKKIVIADRLSLFVNAAYNDISSIDGLVTFLAIIFFAFQLYFDFSGYSDIAIGASRTLGFNLSKNFNSPYLSKSFSEFWNRWHISLSSWFRDYLYIPLGGNKTSNFLLKRNVFIVFIISGLWHGASWNFIIWGFINGAFVVFLNPLIINDTNSIINKIFNPIFVSLTWAFSLVFFRAQTIDDAFKMYGNLLNGNNNIIYNYNLNYIEFTFTVFILILYMCFEIIKEFKPNIVSQFSKLNVFIKWPVYILIILFIVLFGSYGLGIDDSNFIYFQF